MRDHARGESHGGVFLVDLEEKRVATVLDARHSAAGVTPQQFAGGLRGIAFDRDRVFIAGRDQLFAFSPEFDFVGSYRSPYLRLCQGMSVFERRLFVVSPACDSVLGFDLDRMQFTLGLHIAAAENDFRAMPFDPLGQKGPQFVNKLQLNNVHGDEEGLFVSGRLTEGLLSYGGRRITRVATLPRGVHDARPWRNGVLFNDSEAGAVRFVTNQRNHVFRAPVHPPSQNQENDLLAGSSSGSELLRGLCVIDDHRIVSGSSPSTITLHDVAAMKTTLAINLSQSTRSAIYGLEVWPFAI